MTRTTRTTTTTKIPRTRTVARQMVRRLSRVPHEAADVRREHNDYLKVSQTDIHVTGRVTLTMAIVRAELKNNSYTFEAIVAKVLRRKVPLVPAHVLTAWWDADDLAATERAGRDEEKEKGGEKKEQQGDNNEASPWFFVVLVLVLVLVDSAFEPGALRRAGTGAEAGAGAGAGEPPGAGEARPREPLRRVRAPVRHSFF